MTTVLILYRLQKIDSQLDQLNNRLSEIDKLLNEDLALRNARQEYEEALKTQHQMAHSLKQAEEAVQAQQIKIEETEASLYSGRIRNPKELQDLQHDVASLKRYLNEVENQQLEAMLSLEQTDKLVIEKHAALKTVEGVYTAQNATHLGKKMTLQKDGERLEAERKAVTASIMPEDIKIYDRLRQQKRGIAIAVVSDGSCEACGSTLTPAEWQISRSPNKLYYCPICGRILYSG